MERYELLFKRSVAKDLRRIPNPDVAKILERIYALSNEPRPSGSQKLTGEERYRIRQGVYRIIYEIADGALIVTVVSYFAPKSEVQSMPYVNIKVTREGVTPEQKAALIEGVTDLLQRVLNKNPATTMVVIDEVETDNWGIGGEQVTHRRKRGE